MTDNKPQPPSTQNAAPGLALGQAPAPAQLQAPSSSSVLPVAAAAAVPTAPAAAASSAGTAAPARPSSNSVAHKVEEADEPYTISCICDFPEDDGSTIFCENCETWQHIDCFYPDNRDEAMQKDFAHSCNVCKPRDLDRQRALLRTEPLRKARYGDLPSKKPVATKRPPSKSHKKKPKPSDLQLNGNHAATGPGAAASHNSSNHTAHGAAAASSAGPGQDHQHSSKHTIPNDHHHHPAPTAPPAPLAKKPKHSHKPSQSSSVATAAAAHAAKRSPSYGQARPNALGHPPSPATTPPDLPSDHSDLQLYSEAFLSLYNGEAPKIVNYNTFASLDTGNALSLWLRDPDRMRADTGHDFSDVFQPTPDHINAMKPDLVVEDRTAAAQPPNAPRVHWRTLVTPTAIQKNVPLAELNGRIGLQKDYSTDPANMWDELTCPLPFVFFHPMLPLYVDARKEGSVARYVRRSCKPNATLESYVTGANDCCFWLVSDVAIAAGEQITLPWDFRFPKRERAAMLRLMGLADDADAADAADAADMYESLVPAVAGLVGRVLAEYGGCACDLGANCAFARSHRLYQGKVAAAAAAAAAAQQARAAAAAAKKRSRTKLQLQQQQQQQAQQQQQVHAQPRANHTISPTSTGHATNSRAPSEGHGDDGLDDGRSASGSTNSKPPSRDLTPAPRQGSFDTFTPILTEPTGRDKRKVAMLEDQFRALEQPRPSKKKRVSDGTTAAAAPAAATAAPPVKAKTSKGNSSTSAAAPANGFGGASAGAATVNGAGFSSYADAATTSRSKSASPVSALSPSMPGGGGALPQPTSRQASVGATSQRATSLSRPNYRDATLETDPVEGEWYSHLLRAWTPSPPQRPRKRLGLGCRLVRAHHMNAVYRQEAERRRSSLTSLDGAAAAAAAAATAAVDGGGSMIEGALVVGLEKKVPLAASSSSSSSLPQDPLLAEKLYKAATSPGLVSAAAFVAVTGSHPALSPSLAHGHVHVRSPLASPKASKPPHITLAVPSSASGATSPVKVRSPDLRVQMPPVPVFSNSGLGLATVTTPLSANGGLVQSPFTTNLTSPFSASAVNGLALAQQSPMRKKLSLSDYRKRGDKTAAAAGKTMGGPTRAAAGTATAGATSAPDEAKAVVLDVIVDSPTSEKPPAADAAMVNGSMAKATTPIALPPPPTTTTTSTTAATAGSS